MRFGDLTINIGFFLSGQLGVGIKGFLEAWVRLTASLNFLLRLSMLDTSPSSFTITAGLDLTVGVTAVFTTISKNWHLAGGQIWPKKNANLLAVYMNAGANDGTEAVEAVSDAPFRYPALTPEMKEVQGTYSQRDGGSESKILRIGGKTLLFCILMDKTRYGEQHRRVSWCCLDADTYADGLWHSAGEFIEKLASDNEFFKPSVLKRSDYDFDVYTDGQFVYLVATCARDFDANGYPVPNDLSEPSRYDLNMGIYYLVLEHEGKGQLK